jgi:hypothetical protein
MFWTVLPEHFFLGLVGLGIDHRGSRPPGQLGSCSLCCSWVGEELNAHIQQYVSDSDLRTSFQVPRQP